MRKPWPAASSGVCSSLENFRNFLIPTHVPRLADRPNTKSDAVYAMAQDFLTRGVPLDGIGFQMHISGINYTSLRTNFKRFNDLGLDLHITEMDVRVPVDANGDATPANLDAQAEIYWNVLGVALGQPYFKGFQTWGLYDGDSWIPGFFNRLRCGPAFHRQRGSQRREHPRFDTADWHDSTRHLHLDDLCRQDRHRHPDLGRLLSQHHPNARCDQRRANGSHPGGHLERQCERHLGQHHGELVGRRNSGNLRTRRYRDFR